jgi:competence protein ComEA
VTAGPGADVTRVPHLERVRLGACAVLALVAALPLLRARDPGPAVAVVSANGCALVSAPARAAACPCAALPAELRDLRGLPLPLNGATPADLEILPGIGPQRARAIVADRDARGAFARVADLERVVGIGSVTVARLEPRLFVGPDPACERNSLP